MTEVKAVGLVPTPLPSGRLLRPGRKADVDIDDPEIAQQIEAGQLVPTMVTEVPAEKVADILEWVGDDHERAAAALAAERNRPQPRTTLTQPLEQLLNTTQETT